MEWWLLFGIVFWIYSSYKYRNSTFKDKERTEPFVSNYDRTESKPTYTDSNRDKKIQQLAKVYNSLSKQKEKELTTLVNPLQYSNQFCSKEQKLEYMQSFKWKLLKLQRLTIADHCCEVEGCTETTNLQLHHITYERLLEEDIKDLRIVCKSCHQQIHNKLGYDRTDHFPIN